MADIRPFRGLRFDPRRVDVSAVVCPPYDVISPAEQEAYHARDPHNVIRIELGLGSADPSVPGNRYEQAAQALAAWRHEGVLIEEARPAIYLYEHAFDHGGRQLARHGVLVAGRLHDWPEGVVLPHEDTRAGPKQDRLALMRATAINVSPLWLLYDDTDGAVRRALDRAWEQPPATTAETPGERHRLRVVDDPSVIGAVMAAFQSRPLYIADGHHRYETAQHYRDERRRQAAAPDPDAGYEFALMLLVALDDPGLVVLPYHRLVRHDRPTEAVRASLKRWFTLEPLVLPAGDDAAGAAIGETLAAAGTTGQAFVLYETGGAWLLRLRDDVDWRARLERGHSPAWQALDVTLLDALVIRDVCGIEAHAEAAHTGVNAHGQTDRLSYVSHVASALAAVRAGAAQLAYLLNPTPVAQVCAVAATGDRMPPKSTFFAPKPVTGLVMHPLDGTRRP